MSATEAPAEVRRVLVENTRTHERWEQEIVSATSLVITTRDERGTPFTWIASSGVSREHMTLRLVRSATLTAR